MITHGGRVFEVARAHGWDWRDVIDFSASINPLGPSPRVRPAIAEAMDRIVHYPDPYAERLTARLSEHWGVDPDSIIAGNGATELIHFLARVLPSTDVTLAVPVFTEFHRAWPDARYVAASDADRWPDDGLLVITRPNNPTGEFPNIPRRHGLTLADESFIDFTGHPAASPASKVLILRSLTKFYALPGLRLGALIGPVELIAELRKRREPWQVNVLAEAAALASIGDAVHARRTLEYIATERERMMAALGDLPGVTVQPSCANYLFAKLAYPASQLAEWMAKHRVIIRKCTGWLGVEGEAVRIAIRRESENARLLDLWRSFEWRV
jgi:threonine-phosphate decarboxylase